MTRTFDGKVCCPKCGAWHTQETALERWIRNSEELDSRLKGIVRFDCDILLHRYKVVEDKKSQRDIQCMMFIEAKTRGGKLTEAQRDTLSMFNQVLRNRHPNIHAIKHGRHAEARVPPCRCFSFVLRRYVRLWLFGGHLLVMSHDAPDTSDWMEWDNKRIELGTLVQLLRFDRDPDTLRSIDWRRRSFAALSLTRPLFT
jgi:hypothetical protein